MTKYLCVILLTISLLFVSKSVLAQGVSPSTDAAKQDVKVELKFDESDDVTTANLKPILLSGADPDKLQLEAFAFFRGRTPMEEPSPVNLSIGSGSKREWFATNRDLVFVLDTERLSLGPMRRVRRACKKTPPSGLGCLYWDEILDISLSPQTFARIVRAKKVDGEAGPRKFSLKDSDLEILRDFARQILPREQKN